MKEIADGDFFCLFHGLSEDILLPYCSSFNAASLGGLGDLMCVSFYQKYPFFMKGLSRTLNEKYEIG